MNMPSFIADSMLGRLAKWLRIMGFDTVYFKDIEDDKLIKIAQEENRTLLTRDTKLKIPSSVKSVFVKDDHWFYQARQILSSLPGTFSIKPLSRCILCNSVTETIRKDDISFVIPPYVYSTQKIFYQCPTCKKIYWKGTHQEHVHEILNLIIEGTGFGIEGEEFQKG